MVVKYVRLLKQIRTLVLLDSKLDQRIDHLLLDLKNVFETRENPLSSALEQLR